MQGRKSRRHGLSCPWHCLQVLAFASLLFQAGVSAVVLPLLEPPLQVHVTQLEFCGISGSLQILVLALGLLLSTSDPTDPTVYEHQKAKALGLPFNSSRYPSECTLCGTSVEGSSKHCGTCNRCVVGFDHHCKWLNTCIGSKNYARFLTLLGTLVVSEGVFCGFAGMFLQYAANVANEQKEMQCNPGVVLGLLGGALLLAATGFIAVSGLLLAHIWLRLCCQMTTYQFIQAKRRSSKYRDLSCSSAGSADVHYRRGISGSITPIQMASCDLKATEKTPAVSAVE